jgi:hypothetical protein
MDPLLELVKSILPCPKQTLLDKMVEQRHFSKVSAYAKYKKWFDANLINEYYGTQGEKLVRISVVQTKDSDFTGDFSHWNTNCTIPNCSICKSVTLIPFDDLPEDMIYRRIDKLKEYASTLPKTIIDGQEYVDYDELEILFKRDVIAQERVKDYFMAAEADYKEKDWRRYVRFPPQEARVTEPSPAGVSI